LQKKILRAIFNDGKKRIFIRAGRKFGKTECLLYIINRIAAVFPKQTALYITPTLKQGKKIIWKNRRLQDFCPKEFGVTENETETTIKFPNGSYIELDGSESF
jgi:hypothetical protein